MISAIIIFLVGGCLERRDPFFHFSPGFGAQDERPERSDDLEAMVGVLDAALGNAQIRKADLVEDHRLGVLCIVKSPPFEFEVSSPPSLERRRLLHEESFAGADR